MEGLLALDVQLAVLGGVMRAREHRRDAEAVENKNDGWLMFMKEALT